MRWMRGAAIAGVTLLAGCRGVATVPPSATPRMPTLEPVPRQLSLPDLSAIPAASDLTFVKAEQPGYYRLTAEDCESLACRNCPIANLLESARTVKYGPISGRGGRESSDWIRVAAARHLGQEARLRAAGAALTLYYKLLEAELKKDLLELAHAELEQLIRANDKLAARGFKPTTDGFELQIQRVEQQADEARLRAGIAQGNTELKSFLAIEPNVTGFLLPTDQVRVAGEWLDAELAVVVGLERRPDLNLIRTLANTVDHKTLVAVKQAMVGLAPVIAAVQSASETFLPPLAVVTNAASRADADVVRGQLQNLLRDREREANKSIRAALDEWHSSREVVAISRKRVDLAQARVAEFDKKAKAGFGVELELRKARLDAVKAQGELVTELIRWKLADVKAKQEMGLLCGGIVGNCSRTAADRSTLSSQFTSPAPTTPAAFPKTTPKTPISPSPAVAPASYGMDMPTVLTPTPEPSLIKTSQMLVSPTTVSSWVPAPNPDRETPSPSVR